MTSSAFRRHRSPAKWAKGSFTLPNKLVQDKDLSDSGFRLLAWMVSCSTDWIIYQTDIMRRFDWGRERLKSAIDNLMDCKYLFKFPQQVLEGKYGPCDYAFEPDGFTDEEIEGFKITLPMYGNPTSTGPTSTSPTSKPIPSILTNPKEKQQQNAAASSSMPKKKEAKEELIYPCLLDLGMSKSEMIQVTRSNTEERISEGVKLAMSKKKAPKNLAAFIVWAAADGIKAPLSAEDNVRENRKLAKNIAAEVICPRGITLEILSNHVEIVYHGCSKQPVCLYYMDLNFKIELKQELTKNKFRMKNDPLGDTP